MIAVGGSVACVLLLVSVVLATVALYCLRVYKRRREKIRLGEFATCLSCLLHYTLYSKGKTWKT